MREPDRVVHERLSVLHPEVLTEFIEEAMPSDVSVSVADVPRGGAWQRQLPTVQVEGGSYSLPAARQLCEALLEVLSLVGEEISYRPE